MTKREQAAQLLAELTEMAANNTAATAMLDATVAEHDDPIKKKIKSTKVGGGDGVFSDDSELSLETFVTVDWTSPDGKRHNETFELESESSTYSFDKIQAGSEGQITVDANLILAIDWFWSNPKEMQKMRFEIPFTSDVYSDELKAGKITVIDRGGERDALETVNPEVKLDLVGTNLVSVMGGAIAGAMNFSRTTTSGQWEIGISGSGSTSAEVSGKIRGVGVSGGGGRELGGSGKYTSGTTSETETRVYKAASLATINPKFEFKLRDIQKKIAVSAPVFFENVNQSELSEVTARTVTTWWLNEQKNHDMEELSDALKDGKYYFVVYGSTDKQGSSKYNKALGEKRALAVIEELKTMVDFSENFPGNFSEKSFGENQATKEDSEKERSAYIKFRLRN